MTAVTAHARSSGAVFYLKGTRVGPATLNAAVGGLSVSQAMSLTLIPATALALTLPTGTISAGTCMGGTVQVKDVNGSNTQVDLATSVSLEAIPAADIAFFADAACTTPATSVSIAAQEGSATFYFQGQVTGTMRVSASSTGLTPASQDVQINPGVSERLVFKSSAQTVAAGVCSQPVQIQSQDALGNASPVTATTTLSLSASSTNMGFKFYSDSSCTTEVTTASIASGESTAAFYFKGTTAGSVTVIVTTATGFTGNSQVETINPGGPKSIILSGPAVANAGACSAALSVLLQDAFGNPTNATANTTINLSATGKPLTFSTSSTCSGTVSSVTIPSGSSMASFYFKGTQAGISTITGTSTGLTSGSLGVTINAGSASSLVFTTTSPPVTAGNCSTVTTVQLQDSFGNPVKVTSDTAVSLAAAPPDGFQFFASAGCGGAPVTAANMPANSSDASFYFKGTRSGPVTLTANIGSISKTQNVTINPGSPSVLVLSTASQTLTAGAVCTPITLQTQDSYGNPSTVSSNTTVGLSANPSTNFTFYSNNTCGTTTTSVQVSSGQNSATFYVKPTKAGSVTVTATNASYTNGTLTLTVKPAAASKVVFLTLAQTPKVGACSGITTVELQDSFGNSSPASANTTINLSSSTGNITFYSGAGCTTATTTATVATTQSSASFYFKDGVVENVTITAASTGLTSATQQQTINPLTPTELAFVTAPQTVTVTACSGIATVETRASGTPTTVTTNTTVNLSVSPTGGVTFYSNGTCTTPVTQLTIGAGQGSANFYFKGTTPGTVTLTASSTGLTSATQTETLNAAPTRLQFSTPARTTTAGACSAIVTVQSADSSGTAAAVLSNTNVSLSASGTPTDTNFKFYSDSSCGTVVTSVTLLVGQSAASFYYKGQIARTATLTATATGLTTANQNQTLNPANASVLAFSLSTPAQTLLAGTCALRTVESKDGFGNFATNGVTFNLSGSTAAEFFSDASCTTPITQRTIAAGSSSVSFYFKGYTGGLNTNATLTLTASAAGLTSATQNETVTPTVRTGSCSITGTSTNACGGNITPALSDSGKALLVFRPRCRARAPAATSTSAVSWTPASRPPRSSVIGSPTLEV